MIAKEAEGLLGDYLAPKMAKTAAQELADRLAPALQQGGSEEAEQLRARVLEALYPLKEGKAPKTKSAPPAPAPDARPEEPADEPEDPEEVLAATDEAEEGSDSDDAPDAEAPPQRSPEAREKMSLKRKVYHACKRLDAGKATDKDKKFLASNPVEVKLFRDSQAAKHKTTVSPALPL
jgi:hypothetical protein